MSDEQPATDDVSVDSLRVQVEAVLFIAAEPLSVRQIAQTTESPPAQVEAVLRHLANEYTTRGIHLQRHGDTYQFVTAPSAAAAVARHLGLQPGSRLSSAALEVLAIIAYRQPITRAQIDAVRGVDSSATLRALIARDLVVEVGRLDTAGRPILYGTDNAFLLYFGLSDIAQLPPLDPGELPA